MSRHAGILAILLFLHLSILCAVSCHAYDDVIPTTRISKLFVVARHGARSPETDQFAFKDSVACCNESAWNTAWPMGMGNLTLIGADLQQELGRFIRNTYGDQPALPAVNDPKTVSLMADPNSTRCIYSLLNNTLGVFPNSSDPPTFNGVKIDALYWQTFKSATKCNIIVNNNRVNLESPWFRAQSIKWAPLLNYTCGLSTTDCGSMTNALNLSNWAMTAVDTQMSSFYYASFNGTGAGNILPKWYNNTIFDNLYEAGYTTSYWGRYFNAENVAFPQAARLYMGNYFQMLALAFSNNASWAQGTGPNADFTFPSGINPKDTTYSINLGHDDNVAQILMAMGAFGNYNYMDPPFASAIFFELHENVANSSQKFVRTGFRHWFWNETTPKLDYITPIFCNDELCPLETFVGYLRDNLYVGNSAAFDQYCAEQQPSDSMRSAWRRRRSRSRRGMIRS